MSQLFKYHDVRVIERDREKQEWCFLNHIKYVELPYNESLEQWTHRIKA